MNPRMEKSKRIAKATREFVKKCKFRDERFSAALVIQGIFLCSILKANEDVVDARFDEPMGANEILSISEKLKNKTNFPVLNSLKDFDDFAALKDCDRELKRVLKIACDGTNPHIMGAILGDLYEGLREMEDRKRGGVYYTPPDIVETIVNNTVGRVIDEKAKMMKYRDFEHLIAEGNVEDMEDMLTHIFNLRVVDPSCGAGHFLAHTYNILIDRISEILSAMNEEMNENIYIKVLSNSIYGVDKEADAISVAKMQLIITMSAMKEPSFLRYEFPKLNLKSGNAIIGLTPYEMPERESILNYLPDAAKEYGHEILSKIVGTSRDKIRELKAFHWVYEFSDVFKLGGFDVVLGNPPYGNIMGEGEKSIVTQLYRTASGDDKKKGSKNIASLFIELGYKILKPKGVFGMIVPHRITRTEEFGTLIDFLLNDVSLYMIIDSGNPFKPHVNLEMVELFYEKGNKQGVCLTTSRKFPSFKGYLPKELCRKMGLLMLYFTPELERFFRKMNQGARLGVIDSTQGKPRRRDYSAKREVPCVGAKDIDPYRINLISGRYVSMDYVKRKRLVEHMNETALISPNFSNRFEVAIKPKGMVADGTAVVIKPKIKVNKHYLMALLNSKVINFYLWNFILNRAKLTNNICSFITNRIPVKVKRVSEITKLSKAAESGENVEEKINELIGQIYLGEEYEAFQKIGLEREYNEK